MSPKRPASWLWFAHVSLQFSDPERQQRADLVRIFELRADVVTFTEAHHTNALYRLAPIVGDEHGYDVHVDRNGCGVAVRREYARITRRGYLPGIGGSRPGEPVHGPRGLAWVRIRTRSGENIGVGAMHYVTRGDKPSRGFRYLQNRKLARLAGRFARTFAVGSNLVFVAGDFNKSDKAGDVFWGQPLTTCWDELGKWPNTGHGNIDAIASYDPDTRVKCRAATVLDDSKVKLYTDHFVARATYDIAALS